MVFEYDYDEEAQRIRINCVGAISETSVEDYDLCMATTIEKLMEVKRLVRVVLAGSREYEYDFSEAKLLLEIGYAIERIIKERIISMKNVAAREDDFWIQQRYGFLQNFLNRLKYDPIEAYKSLLREIRHSKIMKEKEPDYASKISYQHYINNSLEPIRQILEECELIQIAKPQLTENKNRSLYRKIFHPTIRPNFIYTRYVSLPPPDAELLERYRMGDTDVEIYRVKGKLRNLYHVIPPEFRLDENEYTLLDTARRYLGRHEPVEGELSRPENVRENLYRIGLDMIRDIANNNNMQLSEKKLSNLAKILTRYTAGLGILDLILQDDKIQDIAVNSPVGTSPVYIYHADYHECETNIVPSQEDAESWATRFRLSSGRPFDEANPVLDTELEVPGGRARVAAITRTLSPDGLGFAFRRHRDKPWTFPLFIKNRMIDSFSAGLLWFLIDGSRTMLIAGTRSSGKTSFLSSCIVQIMPKIRIVSLEDTLEIPVPQLRELGYNIERLKSRSVITNVETELPAEEGLRTALRLGDSSLIVGEVRSREAIALYEAMRIGALANLVAGTIHGESAYGVFDRVVNDLGVPPTSFKATDIVVVNNMIRSPDGLHSFRRTVELTEIRKHWSSDPVKEGGFVNLLEYSAKEDKLKPTKTLLTGESEIINDIMSRVREWRGNWDAVWENITMRQKILQSLVDYSDAYKRPDIMEAPSVIESNSMFHIASADIKEETGSIDNKLVYERWHDWLEKKVRQ
ncbi:MAG: type II/IV secretion system ATPase subunit [Candidatus Aenigmarchaeota archaeon]|nr:type II/IV secretion system ATPase subunit [Candidatus Aenigmarchaeota archaeon]